MRSQLQSGVNAHRTGLDAGQIAGWSEVVLRSFSFIRNWDPDFASKPARAQANSTFEANFPKLWASPALSEHPKD